MKTTSISKVVFSAVIAVAASLSTGAMAERYSETHVSTTAEGLRTVTVSYSDLDLSDPRGQETLERCISKAALTLCGSRMMSGWREHQVYEEGGTGLMIHWGRTRQLRAEVNFRF